MSSAVDLAGGPDRVAAINERFVREMAADPIIGFLFAGKDLPAIARHETELAVRLLGGEATYSGRPLGAVHRALRIHRGHFRRRLFVLRRVLAAEAVPEAAARAWVDHHAAMESAIVAPEDCLGPA